MRHWNQTFGKFTVYLESTQEKHYRVFLLFATIVWGYLLRAWGCDLVLTVTQAVTFSSASRSNASWSESFADFWTQETWAMSIVFRKIYFSLNLENSEVTENLKKTNKQTIPLLESLLLWWSRGWVFSMFSALISWVSIDIRIVNFSEDSCIMD